MEAAAAAGQIVLSPATAATLARRAAAATAGRRPAARPPRPRTARRAEPLPPLDGLDLGGVRPAAVRAHVAGGHGEPEHRGVAVAFVQFSGTDALLARAGADALAAALDAVVRNVQDAADEHGVTFLETDIDGDGGKIMLVAGAPRPARATRSGCCSPRAALVDRPGALPLRIGVNHGGRLRRRLRAGSGGRTRSRATREPRGAGDGARPRRGSC